MRASTSGGPIVVVGAGRSGTTMIRRALGMHPEVVSAPFELNYLWRYGNRGLPHDFLVPEEHLSPRIKEYIAENLEKIRKREGQGRLLDKTVANVVRLRYVQAVLPDARIVHVIRDGRAVAASAINRWSAPQPKSYYLSKARLIPPGDLPTYVWRYLTDIIRSRVRGKRGRRVWGVRFPGIETKIEYSSLAQLCAMQWRHSVEAALQQACSLDEGSYLEVRYERLVADPVASYEAIQQYLGLTPAVEVETWVRETNDPARKNRWKEQLSAKELKEIMSEAGQLVGKLGYA